MIKNKLFISALTYLLLCPFGAAAQTFPAHTPTATSDLFPKITDKIQSEEKMEENRILFCAGLTHLNVANKQAFKKAYAAVKDKQDWLILVDPSHLLPEDYQPKDLCTQTGKNWPKKAELRQEAMVQMNTMIAAAKKDGVRLVPISTYRTWAYQNGLYQRNLAKNGGKPSGYVARAGESQHHLGTAIDFNTVNTSDENIPALVWLRQHAGEYGFSLSFPKGAEAEQESGYPYEAWHYRYITKEAVTLQNEFFGGDQHKTLKFLHDCVFDAQPTK